MSDTQMRSLVSVVAVIVLCCGCLGAGGGPQTSIAFQERTTAVGIDYQTDGGGAGNGNDGVYVVDYNRDGWQDLLAIGGKRPVLFRNVNGTFEREAVIGTSSVKSALFFDADGDGFEELLLLRPHRRPLLFQNNNGSLSRSTAQFGNLSYPMGATAGDYDRDGDLDLLIYQSGDWKMGKPDGYFSLYKYLKEDNGNPNVLYENTATGFERVNDSGLSDVSRWSLAASFVDLNGDHRPDLHVANDFNTDTVYINTGDGTFERHDVRGNSSRNGMSSEIADINGDRHQDVFTTNIHLPLKEIEDPERYERLELLFGLVIKSGRTKGNTLMINDGTGNLTDTAVAYGVRDGGWGWAATLTDFDHDGDQDLLHATQYVVRINRSDPHYTYPMLFERTHRGFESLDAAAHNLTELDGRGLATLDYDRDGDRDVIVAPYDGRITVYENTGAEANSIAVRVADASGTTIDGAEITASSAPDTMIQQTVRSDFLSQESRLFHIGVGTRETVDLTVRWPDGTKRTFEDVETNQQLRITKHGIETVRRYQNTSTE